MSISRSNYSISSQIYSLKYQKYIQIFINILRIGDIWAKFGGHEKPLILFSCLSITMCDESGSGIFVGDK